MSQALLEKTGWQKVRKKTNSVTEQLGNDYAELANRLHQVERNFNVSRGMGYYGAKVFKNPAKPKMAVQK